MNTPMKFKLSIELGNDAMLLPRDVAKALNAVAIKVRKLEQLDNRQGSAILDDNGNWAGVWMVIGGSNA